MCRRLTTQSSSRLSSPLHTSPCTKNQKRSMKALKALKMLMDEGGARCTPRCHAAESTDGWGLRGEWTWRLCRHCQSWEVKTLQTHILSRHFSWHTRFGIFKVWGRRGVRRSDNVNSIWNFKKCFVSYIYIYLSLCLDLFGWWFGTCFIFHYIWDNPSHWLIFFRGIETTNQIVIDDNIW